jgi:hypothetical protein
MLKHARQCWSAAIVEEVDGAKKKGVDMDGIKCEKTH